LPAPVSRGTARRDSKAIRLDPILHSAASFEGNMPTVRHFGTGGARLLGLAGGLLLASALAAEAPGEFDRPSPLERLEPGSTVVASWTLDPTAVRGLDEAELVLSFDGGLTYPVRLTGRILPDARSTTWRVPAFPSEHARIALRAGLDEQAGTEELLFVSEAFVIASPGKQPHEDLFAVNDEWRTREALEGAPVRPPSSSTCQSPDPDPELDPIDADDADDAGTDDALAGHGATARGDLAPSVHPHTTHAHQPIPDALREAPAPLRL
jgi:hypothetical protein